MASKSTSQNIRRSKTGFFISQKESIFCEDEVSIIHTSAMGKFDF
jgi:hypothetical protein